MIFKKLRFKNVLSFGNRWTEIDLDTGEIVAIMAGNGVGKSSILDAIHYALTGKPYRNINKPKLINSFNKKGLEVELTLNFKGSEIFIRRGMLPNIFEIHKDGVPIGENSSITDFQVVLEQMLEIDSKTIRQTMMMSSRYYTPFLQLYPADKRAFIESILSIKMFSSMCDNLKQRITNLKQEQGFIEKDIDKVKSNIKLLEDVSEKQKKEIKKTQRNLKKKIEDLQKKNEQYSKKIDSSQSKVKEINDRISKYQSKLVRSTEINQRNAKLQHDLETLKKRVDFFNDNDVCPICTQDISDEISATKMEEFAAVETRIKSKLEKIGEALEKIQKLNERISQLNQAVREEQQNISDLQYDIRSNDKEILSQKEQFNELKSKLEESDDGSLKKFEDEKKSFEERRANITLEQNRCTELIKLLSEKGIKKFILRKYIPVLNKLVNQYLQMLDAKYQIMFDDEINEQIIARGYEDLGYNNFSGGERQRVDLALLFAFLELSKLKNSVDSNLIILDEVLDQSLDQTGINGVFAILHHLKRQGNTIWVISHRENIEDHFDRVIKITKKRFSEIDES